MSFLKKILILGNITFVVGIFFSYLSPTVDPNENWFFSFFGVFYPILLLFNLAFIVVWILLDYKYLFLSLIAILLGWQHLTHFVNISTNAKDEIPDLSIMSYNLGSTYGLRDADKAVQEIKIQAFSNYLATIPPPDIICLQETNSLSNSLFKKRYANHTLLNIENKGVVLFSKYPIINSGVVEFGTKTNSCIYGDIKFEKGIVRVYNLHLQSNKISKVATEVLDNANLNETETWSSIAGILSKYKHASSKRSRQAQKVKSHAESSPYPIIIAGDINDPPTSYSYNLLQQNLNDSFHCSGSGIGTTYGGSIPMLRIDYILFDENFESLSYTCRKEDFSDHYPIFSTLNIGSER